MIRNQPAPSSSSSSSSSRCPSSSPLRKKSNFRHMLTEFACSACMYCLCCPLSIVWCFFIFPSKVVWHLARKGKCGGGVSCFDGYRRVSSAVYSSSSDIDSDDPSYYSYFQPSPPP